MGSWIYGCDLCQQACPWQRFAQPTAISFFHSTSPDRAAPRLPDLLALDDAGFHRRFAGTPILRSGRARLLRNVAVALGNSGDPRATPALEAARNDPAALVREHAAWALAALRTAPNAPPGPDLELR